MPKNIPKNITNQHGFTLIEMVVSLGIFTILSLGVIGLVGFMFTGSNQQANLITDNDQGRRMAFGIIGELRNATTSATGAYSLDTVSDQQLIFYSNVDNDNNIERVRYYLSNGKMYRGVVDPTGSPPVYNTGNETSKVVQNNVANGASIPLFYYYDDTYDDTMDNFMAQPVNVTNVKFIKLNVRIYNKAGVTKTAYYTVSAGAAIRNLKTNLGD